jgi:hypothetical protein
VATLQGSVGRRGQNNRSDVILVQQLLNQNLPIPLQVLKVDGIVGPRTIFTIEEYQRRNVPSIRPDGRVDPGGKTFRALALGIGPQPPGPPPPAPVPTPPGPAAGAILRFSVAQFRAFSKDLEGEVLNMYLDTHNPPLVTIGVGNMIEPISVALSIDYVYKSDNGGHPQAGQLCSPDDKKNDFNTVKGMTAYAPLGGGNVAFKTATVCRITQRTLEKLITNKLNGNADYMKKNYFSALDTWSADAQLGLMSMAWAMGSAFPTAPPSGPWPNFTKACKDQNWEGAAKECKMKNAVGTQVKRNDRNVILFRNAARIKEGKGDANVLQWPKDLNA